jgi:hypothetical protein
VVGVTGRDLNAAEIEAGIEHRGDEGVAQHEWVQTSVGDLGRPPGQRVPLASSGRL